MGAVAVLGGVGPAGPPGPRPVVRRVTDIRTDTYPARPGEIVRCDQSDGDFDVRLPRAADLTADEAISVKSVIGTEDGGGHVVTVVPYGTDRIDGVATWPIEAGDWKTFVPCDVGWIIL